MTHRMMGEDQANWASLYRHLNRLPAFRSPADEDEAYEVIVDDDAPWLLLLEIEKTTKRGRLLYEIVLASYGNPAAEAWMAERCTDFDEGIAGWLGHGNAAIRVRRANPEDDR